MIPANDLLPYLSVLSLALSIGLVAGSFSYAFRNGRQSQLAKFQNDTNIALQQRVTALEGKAADLEKENIIQHHVIEMITSALEKEGFIITVNGDMVTIENSNTGMKSHRKRIVHHAPGAIKKEEP